MFRKFNGGRKVYLFLFFVVFVLSTVECTEYEAEENQENLSYVPKINEKEFSLKQFSKALTDMIFTGRKKGGGGGGGGMSMFFVRSLMDMFNAYVPMMAMTVFGWMKDVMMLGAGAFMMMMYDQISKKGEEKKIIIKLSPPPPEPAPPAQTGYGPWEGR